MADVNEMFNETTKEESFFVPGKEKKKGLSQPIAQGEYFGHIIGCESKIVDVKKGEFKARLYTYTFQASEENESKTFQFKNIAGEMEDTSGKPYIGYKFRGTVWRFLEPGKKDTFKSNSEGNAGYLRFCDTIGIECPVEKRTINGEDVEVKLLPNLTPEDTLGQPCIAFVDLGRPWVNKEGVRKQYWDSKFIKKWAEGEKKVISGGDDEIPF